MSAVMLTFGHQRTKLLAISLGDEKWEASRFYAQKVAVFSPDAFELASSPSLRSFTLSAPHSFLFLPPCCLAVPASLQVGLKGSRPNRIPAP